MPHKSGVVAHACNLSTQKWRQEAPKIMLTLVYIVSSRPAGLGETLSQNDTKNTPSPALHYWSEHLSRTCWFLFFLFVEHLLYTRSSTCFPGLQRQTRPLS